MKLQPYQIPRSDKKDRCAECLIAFKKGQLRFPSDKHRGERFQNVHFHCKPLLVGTREYESK